MGYARDSAKAWAQSHPENSAWRGAKQRVINPKDHAWSLYGGRGIRMCAEWLDDFSAFLAYIGPKPSPELTLDRIDNDGHYEPGNVRWATKSQQASNRRRREWTPEMDENLRTARVEGLSWARAGALVGKSGYSSYHRGRRLGLPGRLGSLTF